MKTNVNFRKFTSLLLTIIMILSMGVTSAFAEDTAAEMLTITVNGQDYMNENGAGVDYSALPTSDTMYPDYNGVKIASNEWVNYKVEAEEAGLYNVALTYRGNSYDGTRWGYLTSNPVAHTDSGILSKQNGVYGETSTWDKSTNTPAIQIYLNKGTNIVTFKFASTTYISKMVFTKEKTGDTTTIYQYALGYDDGGVYSSDGTTVINTDEAKAKLIRNTSYINIGAKTLNDTTYGAFVKYNIVAPETGIYKISLNAGNDGAEWINALKNETLGLTYKGIVPKSTTVSEVSTWALTEGGEYVDITIPMVVGENVISFSKASSALWFDKISFVKVDEYEIEEPDPEPEPEDPVEPEDTAKVTVSVNAQNYIPGGADVSYTDDESVSLDGTSGILMKANKWARYSIYAPEAGLYDVTLTYKTGGAQWYCLTNETLPVAADVRGILSSSNSEYIDVSTWTGSTGTPAIQIYLNEGTNFIKVTKLHGNGYLAKITFTKAKEGAVVYKNALDYSDGGVYSSDGTTVINTDEAKAKLIRNTSYINIGSKTLNDTKYGAFVKYTVNAPETGVYKVSLRLGNYNGEWINALKNETLGVTKAGVVPANTTDSWLSQWKLDNTGDLVDITIPMVKGENVISFEKASSDLWFDNILFTKVDEYPYEYNATYLYNNATDKNLMYNGSETTPGYTYGGTSIALRSTDHDHYITFKFNGKSAKYIPSAEFTSTSAEVGFEIVNNTTGKSVSIVSAGTVNSEGSPAYDAEHAVAASENGLDINNGDSVTVKMITGVTYFFGLSFADAGDTAAASEVAYAATEAEHTNALTVDGSLSMPEGAFAEFNITGEDSLYLAAMSVSAAKDSLIKLTAGTESVYEFIKAGSVESYSLINMPANAEKVIVSVEKGAVSLSEISLYKDTDTSTYSDVLSAFAAAKTVDGVKEALSELMYADVANDMSGTFYSDSVIYQLKKNTYSDITTLLSDYSVTVYNEITNPSVVLKNSEGNAVNELSAGAMTLEIKASWIEPGMSVYMAIYDGNKLTDVDVKEYAEDGISLNVNVPAAGSCTYGIFVWDEMTPYCL